MDNDAPDNDEALSAAWTRARQVHPDIPLSLSAFQAAFQAACPGNHRPARLVPEDLYLACACAAGLQGAAEKFHALFTGTIRRAVARVLSSEATCEEVVQRTLEALLTGDRPKIAQYRGGGPLGNWVSVVATRAAVSTGRAESSEKRLRRSLMKGGINAGDPESELLRHELRGLVETAIKRVLGCLEDRDRLILRLSIVSGASNSAIARMFDVNHSTISRRVTEIRAKLLAEVTRDLRSRQLQPEDLALVLQTLSGAIDVSISRLLDSPS